MKIKKKSSGFWLERRTQRAAVLGQLRVASNHTEGSK